eukprot:gene3512-32422_t
MPNYSNGKIYKVVNDNLNICYIGSTVQPLSVRMSAHQGNHKSGSFARYKKWGKIEDCKIHLIENYPCKDKHELESRERHFIESYRAGTGSTSLDASRTDLAAAIVSNILSATEVALLADPMAFRSARDIWFNSTCDMACSSMMMCQSKISREFPWEFP